VAWQCGETKTKLLESRHDAAALYGLPDGRAGESQRVQVQAASLYEAVGWRSRRCAAKSGCHPSAPPRASASPCGSPRPHEATVASVQEWTDATASSPADKLLRARVREMLLGAESARSIEVKRMGKASR